MKHEQRISRRGFLRLAAATAGAGVLAACGAPATPNAQPTAGGEAPAGGQAQAPAQNNGVKLIFMSDTSNEAIIKVRNEWASKFSAQNSGVTVEHQPVPQEYATKIQTLFAAGTPPDVYRYLQEITPIVTVAQKKLHVPLNSYVQRDSYDLSDYRPDSIELYRWEGELYGLPRDYGNQNLFYNIDLLEAAGIQPPPADWTDTSFTFENFVQMAKALTKKNGDRIEQYGFLVNRGWRPWATWVYNNGAAVVNKDASGLATEIALTDPKAVEALQLLQDMMYKDPVAPRPDIESETGGFELFASGKVGIMLTNPSDVVKFRKIDTFKWDVGTLPLGKASRRGTGGGGTGWAIPSGSKNPDVAWEFLKFISSAEAQLDEVHVGATTPSRVSVVTSKDFADPNQPPAHITAFAQAQEYVVRDPVHPRWPEIFQRILTPTMDQLWGGTKTAAEVTEMIKTEGDKLLKQA